jgi:uncharacterized protein GlcG (DUF336 family)
MHKQLIAAVAAGLLATALSYAEAPTQNTAAPTPQVAAKGPSLAVALKAMQAARSACAAKGYRAAFAIVDSAGELKLFMADDGVPQRPVNAAVRKARTAALFQATSAEIQQRVHSDKALADRIAADPSLIAIPGGLPLKEHGEVIGALAASGAPGGDKDTACAQAGVTEFEQHPN